MPLTQFFALLAQGFTLLFFSHRLLAEGLLLVPHVFRYLGFRFRVDWSTGLRVDGFSVDGLSVFSVDGLSVLR